MLRRLGRASAQMSLRDVARHVDLTSDPNEFVERLIGNTDAMTEVPEVLADVASRMDASKPFPKSRTSLAALYGIVRALRPTTVLETGVEIGVSTAVLLAALDRNGHGQLHSVDIDPGVGRVARAGNTERWTLHVHPHTGGEDALRGLMAQLGDVDIYYHDSGHSWLWQTFEYETAAPHATQLVLSDDIDVSWAFVEHCQERGVRPLGLVELNKVFAGYRPADLAPTST
jgi:predicted O-methyltransferase YrrM